MKCKTILRNFISLIFQWLQLDTYIYTLVSLKIPWSRMWHLNFAEIKRKSFFSILTETRINNDQIHDIRNNWLDSIFFSSGDSHRKGWVFKVSLRLPLIQNGGLSPLRLLPLLAGFYVFMEHQVITQGNSWLGSISLKDYKVIWKIKVN